MLFFLILLWIIVLAVCVCLFVLARQIGVIHQRIHPVGALLVNKKISAGDAAPSLEVLTLNNERLHIGEAKSRAAKKHTLIFFMSPGCSICKSLLPAIKLSEVSEVDWLNILYASDGPEYAHKEFAVKHGLSPNKYIVSEELGRAFGVNQLPYVVLIDKRGYIVSMGLVNTQEQLESIFNTKEMNASSVQEYLQNI